MRAIKIFRFIFLFLTIAMVYNLVSCRSKNTQNRSSKDINDAIRREIEAYAYPLPSVFETTNMLNEIDAFYLAEITHDPNEASNYFTEKSKALNLGVYTADLAYATTYNRKQEMLDYFDSCETLVRELDFTGAFEHDLADRIENSFDNKDELVEIVTGIFQNAYAYLNQQGRTELSYLVLCGTIIEGLYLTTHISESTFQNQKIIAAILFQKEPLLNLQKMMETNKESDLLKTTYLDIRKINEIYALEPGYTSMTEEQVVQLTEILTRIRSGYVNRQ